MMAMRDLSILARRYARNCFRRNVGALCPISFSLSICHHGLNTAPRGAFFNSRMNFSTEPADMAVGHDRNEFRVVPFVLERRCNATGPRHRSGPAASGERGFV